MTGWISTSMSASYAGELALNFEYCSVSHHYIDEISRMSIFKCFVLSNFNYCSLVWNFGGAEYTSKMERIQFRALKFVYNDFNTSYTELLARANLPTLQLHRKREILGGSIQICQQNVTIFYVGLIQSKRHYL